MPRPNFAQVDKDKNFACCFCDTYGICWAILNTDVCRYLNKDNNCGLFETTYKEKNK